MREGLKDVEPYQPPYHFYDDDHTYPAWFLLKYGYRDIADGNVRWWTDKEVDEMLEAQAISHKRFLDRLIVAGVTSQKARRFHRLSPEQKRRVAISVFFPGQGVHAPSGSLDKEAVKSNADIVEVYRNLFPENKLVERYGRATAQCPFHNDKRPSMNLNKEKGTWRCFVCNEGGDVINLVQRSQDVRFQEALKVIHNIC